MCIQLSIKRKIQQDSDHIHNDFAIRQTSISMQNRDRATHLLKQLYDPGTAELTVDHIWQRLPETSTGSGEQKNDCMLITYADSIQSPDAVPLNSLAEFLKTHLPDVVGRVHLLPFYPSSSDDGFAVVDYRMVDHHVGSWAEVETLAESYELMFDLVINHCSRESLWFADFVGGRRPGRNYFITLPEESDVSAVARPRSTPLINPVHTYGGIRHVWNTFSDDQVDLDFTNPAVLLEFVDILLFYIQRGARLIRLDAIGYLWKRLGTSCLNLPETHIVVKLLRVIIDEVDPTIRIITETNVPHDENVAYFGDGDEAHLVYQFSLPPLLLYSFIFGNSEYLQRWAGDLKAAPEGTTFLNFFASHDGIGLRPLEGLVPEDEVDALVDQMHARGGFVTLRDVGEGQQRPYEINISLLSAFGGAEGLPAYLAAHALMLSFQGSPAVYIHSMLGTLNDLDLVEQTGRTRSINRRKWQSAELNAELSNAESIHHQTLTRMIQLISQRNRQPALAATATQEVVSTPGTLFALRRNCPEQQLLVLCNLTHRYEQISLAELDLCPGTYTDHLTRTSKQLDELLDLHPLETLWLELADG